MSHKRQASALSGALAQGSEGGSRPTIAQQQQGPQQNPIPDRSTPFGTSADGHHRNAQHLARTSEESGLFSMAALGSSPIAAPMSYLVRSGLGGGGGGAAPAYYPRGASGPSPSATPTTHGFLVPAVAAASMAQNMGAAGGGGGGGGRRASGLDIPVGSLPISAGMSPAAESWRTAGSGGSHLAGSLPRRTSGMLPPQRPPQRPSYTQVQQQPSWHTDDSLTAPLLPGHRTSLGDAGSHVPTGFVAAASIPHASSPDPSLVRGGSGEWSTWPDVVGPGPPQTLQDTFRARDAGALKAVVFGLINGAVGLPALIAFAAIVFQAPTYTPYLGSLCKLFFLSSALHQAVFCALSSLPFAIGQVQDVGLIFLSAMASAIAVDCEAAGRSPAVALATSLATLTVSTLAVGLATVAVGKLRGAGLVQYVPLPVVGGYLGYVGYFCIAGGLGLGTNTEINTLVSWSSLLSMDALMKLLPTLGSCAALMLTLEHCSHPLALPAVLAAIPTAFHIVLFAGGWSLADAQAAGWAMAPPEGGRYFWQLVDLYNWREGWDGIYWGAALAQLPKLLGLFLVVCFGSCMDVAAIQQDMPQPLDFNRELITVGVSNALVGALGVGYTGSYIFSQTVFTMRAGVFNRLNGWVVAAMELAVFALPFNVVQYCPNFFFGALLFWFGVEISRDWLVLSYAKLSGPEYALLWLTFGAIMGGGLEAGIAGGCVAATLYFAYRYARSQVQQLVVVGAVSGAHHGHEHAALLEQLVGGHVVALALSGFIFFGSSTSLAARVEEAADRLLASISGRLTAARAALASTSGPAPSSVEAGAAAFTGAVGIGAGGRAQGGGRGVSAGSIAEERSPDHMWARRLVALADAPAFVILDFRAVTHLDATGARTFGTLLTSLASRGITVAFSGLSATPSAAATRSLLAAHGVKLQMHQHAGGASASPASSRRSSLVVAVGGGGSGYGGGGSGSPRSVSAASGGAGGADMAGAGEVLGEGCVWEFPSLQAAVGYAEGAFLGLAVGRRLLPPPPLEVSLAHVLAQHAASLPLSPGTASELAAAITPLLSTRTLTRGEVLFSAGQDVEHLILVEQGVLQLDPPAPPVSASGGHPPQPLLSADAVAQQQLTKGASGAHQQGGVATRNAAGRVVSQYGPGCFVVAPEFYLSHPAPASASAASHTCRVALLGREDVWGLFSSHPQGAALLHWAAVRATCLELSAARDTYGRIGPV